MTARRLVESAVAAADARPAGVVEDLRARALTVDDYLERWIARESMPANLRAAITYVLRGGGKRVRPALVLFTAESLAAEERAALPAAAAIELVHDFSLVHDDLPALDDDDLRRGRPTLHRETSEAMAVLAGDALLALAFELLSREVTPPALAAGLCGELATATSSMIAGQVLDTLPDFDPSSRPIERLRITHRNKTGALIRCACRMGAMCAGAGPEELEALTRYGETIGLMFQVVDDVLDVTQSTEHLGKRTHKDSEQNKLTYPGLIGLEASLAVIEEQRRAAHDQLAPLELRSRRLLDLCDWLAVRTR